MWKFLLSILYFIGQYEQPRGLEIGFELESGRHCDINWSQVGLKACDNLYTAWLAMNLINDNYCLHLEDYSGCKFYTYMCGDSRRRPFSSPKIDVNTLTCKTLCTVFDIIISLNLTKSLYQKPFHTIETNWLKHVV